MGFMPSKMLFARGDHVAFPRCSLLYAARDFSAHGIEVRIAQNARMYVANLDKVLAKFSLYLAKIHACC